ncbi:putative vacuolar amino acid transporter YPQ3 [Nakaseomyces bracarensis]|uniref:Vacuolar amino acid transporter YPQ3 n=1 Tax=Nakaseomyces bracarensis TaxID=273131 RepID=A0ABR4NP87_9SACH
MLQLTPIVWDAQSISGIAGSISIACWVVVFVPQIYENFYRKSADGLSLLFVVLWLAGDVFNLVGAMMQHLLLTMVILAAYYTAADVILLIQCLWYDNEEKLDPIHFSPANPINENVLQDVFNEHQPLLNSSGEANRDSTGARSQAVDALLQAEEQDVKRGNFVNDFTIVTSVILGGIVSWYISYCANPPEPIVGKPDVEMNFLAQSFGYLSAVLYLGSRVPQILLNFKRKSCEGISFLFFLFACLGNTTFIISVLAISRDYDYIMVNASWLVGSSGTLVMDFIIFIQFFAYGTEKAVVPSSRASEVV